MKIWLNLFARDRIMNNEIKNNDACNDHDDCCCCHDEHDECDCGCNDNEALIVDLEDENGNVVSCEIVDQFTYNENEYVLVQNPEDGSVYLFKVVGEGENAELVVPEDKEFDEVSTYYNSLSDEE